MLRVFLVQSFINMKKHNHYNIRNEFKNVSLKIQKFDKIFSVLNYKHGNLILFIAVEKFSGTALPHLAFLL